MNKIKACPFCGTEPQVHVISNEGFETNHYISCEDKMCFVKPITRWYVNLNDLKYHWNLRYSEESGRMEL